MSKMHRLWLMLAALLAVSLACQALNGTPSQDNTGPTQGPELPPATQSTSGEVLYEDDFEDTSGAWLSQRDADGITDYDQGGYRIKVDIAEWFFWVQSGRTFTDVQIDVEAKKIGGPDSNELGVICRYQDEDNFYFFTVTSDGYYAVTRMDSEEYILIGMNELRYSEAILQGDATNHLRAVCKGDNLQFYVNGTLLADVHDATLPAGDVGLIVGTTETPGADILFDNLVVTRP